MSKYGEDLEFPLTPYAGTSGWSGSDTSRERAEQEDTDGTTTQRQQWVLNLLAVAAEDGRTWLEVADNFDWHHGQASGALGRGKSAEIARLEAQVASLEAQVVALGGEPQ